jgi:hypothetical protein
MLFQRSLNAVPAARSPLRLLALLLRRQAQ